MALKAPGSRVATHRGYASTPASARLAGVSRARRVVCSVVAPPAATSGLSAAEQEKVKATKVAVFSAQQYVKDFLCEPLKGQFPESTFFEDRLGPVTAAFAKGHTVAVAFVNDDVSEPVLEVLASVGVKMVAMRCAGFDRVDLKAAGRLGIKVARVPTYSPQSVAEHAVGLMFALNRNLHNAHLRTLQGNYSLNGLVGFEMNKKVVGVLGTGAIGYEACRILKGIGCQVLAYDVHPNDKVVAMGIPYHSLDELLPQCDIVSLHCPLLPSTYHLMNAQRLQQMKPGAMLINVSRGGLVESEALSDALESGHLGALGMDVYENEDKVFFIDYTQFESKERMKRWDRKFKALLTYPQVLVTPHSAFLTKEALANIAATTIDNITNFTLDKPLGGNEVIYRPPAA